MKPSFPIAAGFVVIGTITLAANCDTLVVAQDGSADFETIGTAIEAAVEGDVIFISAGTYLESDLSVSVELTIEGELDENLLPAVTIDGQGQQILYFTSTSSLSVAKNLVLTGADETACFCFHSSPTFVNCSFTDNGADEPVEFTFGGAMYNLNGAPVFIDCRFIGNRGGMGGAFSTWESGPDPAHHPLFVRCLFRDNRSFSGGAMGNLRSNPTLVDCVFENNTALISGGAIYNDDFDGPDFWISRPVIENCTFRNNVAAQNGGAIFNEGSSEATITGSLFTENSAGAGGAIMNNGMSFSTLTGTTACGNLPDQITGTWHDHGENSIASECPDPCVGDINADDIVNGADLSILLGEWNQASESADLNLDGFIDGADLTILLGNWGDCPG
jgi:predicted outer membrane repeat protein